MLDTVHRIETPEGVDLDQRVAGPLARMLAWLIDLALRLLAGGVISLVLAVLGEFGIGLLLIALFLLEWSYPILFEVLAHGATPGKKALRLRVVQRDGSPVDWRTSTLRNLLRAADFMPLLYGFGLLSMLFGKDFQRLGDRAAGTLVVYREATRRGAPIPAVPPRPAPLPLKLIEQRNVIRFGQRAPLLPPERALEIARIASPLLEADPVKAPDPVHHLAAIAGWLVGRRPAADSGEQSGATR